MSDQCLCDICGEPLEKTAHNQRRHKECTTRFFAMYQRKRKDDRRGLVTGKSRKGSHPALDIDRPYNPLRATRVCLGCDGEFLSESPYNRICITCSGLPDRYSDPIGRHRNAHVKGGGRGN